MKYLKQAYDTLSAAYVLFFNYRAAAETYDKISSINRFEEAERRDAARNALVLYANMGDTAKMTAVRQRLMTLGPSAQEKAEADYIVADSDMKAWDPRGADDGANRNARQRATNSMSSTTTPTRTTRAAGKYVVEAAYNVARMRAGGGHQRRRVAQEDDRRLRAVQGHRGDERRQERSDGLARGRLGRRVRVRDGRRRAQKVVRLRDRAPPLRGQLGRRHQEVPIRRRRRQEAPGGSCST